MPGLQYSDYLKKKIRTPQKIKHNTQSSNSNSGYIPSENKNEDSEQTSEHTWTQQRYSQEPEAGNKLSTGKGMNKMCNTQGRIFRT